MRSVLQITCLAVALPTGAAQAAVIYSGSFTQIESGNPFSFGNQADYTGIDLEDLGTSDWAYYTRVDDATVQIANSKSGGVGLESTPTVNAPVSGRRVITGPNHQGDFTFDDGVSPASPGSGTFDAPYIRWGSNTNAAPFWEIAVDSTATNQILNLFVATGEAGLQIQGIQGGVEVGDALTVSSAGNSRTFQAEITFGGEVSDDFLFRISATNRNQDNSGVGLVASTLSIVPEPASAALLGLGCLLVFGKRSRPS